MAEDDPPFEVGDLVRLKHGWTALRVVACRGAWLTATYSPAVYREWDKGNLDFASVVEREPQAFVPWDPNDETIRPPKGRGPINHHGEAEPMTQRLYTWKGPAGGTHYGYKLAANSAGQWIMETKGGDGQPVAVAPALVEAVTPYTVLCRGDASDRSRHWITTPGAVEVGDRILTDAGSILVVREINTKNLNAREVLAGLKLTGTILPTPESAESVTDD